MRHLNPAQQRVDDLVRFLCNRRATEQELNAAARPQFNFSYFRIQLLISDECVHRWPQLPGWFAQHVEQQQEASFSAHKLAHDLAVIRRELGRAQSGVDDLQGRMLDMLKYVESIATVSENIKALQGGIIALSGKAAMLEEKLAELAADEGG
jgi:hypothetical protein